MHRHLSMTQFTKTITAGALAITLALTGITATASPAAANGHRNNGSDAAAVLGGLLLLYGLSQAGQHRGGATHNTPAPQVQHPPRPRQDHRVAPAQCFIQGGHGNDRYRGYRYRCMQSNVHNAHRLPQNCLRNVWTDRGQRTIYGARCLQNNGWSQG